MNILTHLNYENHFCCFSLFIRCLTCLKFINLKNIVVNDDVNIEYKCLQLLPQQALRFKQTKN
jgi:hypothetical protein